MCFIELHKRLYMKRRECLRRECLRHECLRRECLFLSIFKGSVNMSFNAEINPACKPKRGLNS